MAHNVIEEFSRKEVEATSTVTDRKMMDAMEALFREPGSIRKPGDAATSQEQERVKKRTEFLASTHMVKDEKKFSAFTPRASRF